MVENEGEEKANVAEYIGDKIDSNSYIKRYKFF